MRNFSPFRRIRTIRCRAPCWPLNTRGASDASVHYGTVRAEYAYSFRFLRGSLAGSPSRSNPRGMSVVTVAVARQAGRWHRKRPARLRDITDDTLEKSRCSWYKRERACETARAKTGLSYLSLVACAASGIIVSEEAVCGGASTATDKLFIAAMPRVRGDGISRRHAVSRELRFSSRKLPAEVMKISGRRTIAVRADDRPRHLVSFGYLLACFPQSS